jgi:hypothetical protein
VVVQPTDLRNLDCLPSLSTLDFTRFGAVHVQRGRGVDRRSRQGSRSRARKEEMAQVKVRSTIQAVDQYAG